MAVIMNIIILNHKKTSNKAEKVPGTQPNISPACLFNFGEGRIFLRKENKLHNWINVLNLFYATSFSMSFE